MVETSSSGLTVTLPSDLEIVMTRVFDAPRHLVFDAWTKPEHLKRWFGPRGWTLPVCEMDRRPGGAWHSRMRSPEGLEYSNRGVVQEIVEPERLVFTFAWDDDDGKPGREMLITITLAEHGSGTEMTFIQADLESVEDRDRHLEGWTESFDKLAEHLAKG
jgi:uncharacterized protein YndB with AHSA1/START domain